MNYWEEHTASTLVSGDEVLVGTCSKAYVYDASKKTKNISGKLSLSTYHLFFHDGSRVKRLSLEYICRSGQSPSSSRGVFGGDKITIPLPGDTYCRLVIKDGDLESFFGGLVSALEKQSWRQAPSLPQVSSSTANTASAVPTATRTGTSSSPGATSSTTASGQTAAAAAPEPPARTANMIGIAGVMHASQQSAQLQSTFLDIDDVMKRASAVVNSIRQLKQRANSGAGEATSEVDATAIESIEATLGLGTMVRASTSKSGTKQAEFHEALAAEMHAWLTHPKNAKLFGEMPIITLIELFSLYNKARSGDMVAPEDVLMASRAMSKQSYSRYLFKTLASGRTALVNKDASILIAKLVPSLGPQLVAPNAKAVLTSTDIKPTKTVETTTAFPQSSHALKSINAPQLASTLQVPVSVAEDALLELEASGVLCRSNAGFDCYTFYWNVFVF